MYVAASLFCLCVCSRWCFLVGFGWLRFAWETSRRPLGSAAMAKRGRQGKKGCKSDSDCSSSPDRRPPGYRSPAYVPGAPGALGRRAPQTPEPVPRAEARRAGGGRAVLGLGRFRVRFGVCLFGFGCVSLCSWCVSLCSGCVFCPRGACRGVLLVVFCSWCVAFLGDGRGSRQRARTRPRRRRLRAAALRPIRPRRLRWRRSRIGRPRHSTR